MVSNLVDAISLQLNQSFGDRYRIYSEEVAQGLVEPCFFIAVLNPTKRRIVGNRYALDCPFNITYLPTPEGGNGEMLEMGADLFTALEFVELDNGDLLEGMDMRYELVDGALQFFLSFNTVYSVPATGDDMGQLVTMTEPI